MAVKLTVKQKSAHVRNRTVDNPREMESSQWIDRRERKRSRELADTAHDAEDPQGIALECLCKMIKLLDGEFAKQVVDAGGVRCLIGAMFGCDARRAMEARKAILCLHDKLPCGYATLAVVSV
jgi:hypothetical protein